MLLSATGLGKAPNPLMTCQDRIDGTLLAMVPPVFFIIPDSESMKSTRLPFQFGWVFTSHSDWPRMCAK